jgi:PmbA protein
MSTPSQPDAELLDAARAALKLAKKHGAADGAATASRSRDVETTWRDGKLEKVSDATSRSVSLALYIDGKYGSMSTSDLRPVALERFVQAAVGLVRALAKDPHRKLPEPSLYQGRTEADLEIFDAAITRFDATDRLDRAKEMEEGARSGKRGADRIVSVTASVSDSVSDFARVTSNGFEGAYQSASVSNECEVSLKDEDGRRPSDWESASVRFAKDLPSATVIGRNALDRAYRRLNAKKIGSGTMTVVVDARAARNLLRHFTGPLSGASLQQKESFFEGKLESLVASNVLTLTDEPLLKRGLASRPFDGEGISSKQRSLIEKGVLRSYLIDVYYANKLGTQPTTGRSTNLVVAPGKKPQTGLVGDMQRGILITDFLGGNSNSTTGVFSLGIAGLRVEGGERKEAISEMNLSGKHLDFWKKLVAVGSDTYVYSSTRSPSLMFEGVSIAGK